MEPPLRNKLKRHVVWHKTVDNLVKKLRDIPNVPTLRLDPELTLLVTSLVENSVKKGNPEKIDKKQLCIDVLDAVFQLTPEEKEQTEGVIEFLFENGRIKRIPFVNMAVNFVGDWFKRKFL